MTTINQSQNSPAEPLPVQETAAKPPIMVQLRINSIHGDDRIVETLENAVKLLEEQVTKFGKWIYVGKNRFRLDPTKSESVRELTQKLTETPSARVTGALRGGAKVKAVKAPKVKKVKLPKAVRVPKAKKAKKVKALAAPTNNGSVGSLPSVQVLVSSKLKLDTSTMELKIAEKMLNPDSTGLSGGEEAVIVVTVSTDNKLTLHLTPHMVALKQQVASLILAHLQD